jgi:hypothetical protein
VLILDDATTYTRCSIMQFRDSQCSIEASYKGLGKIYLDSSGHLLVFFHSGLGGGQLVSERILFSSFPVLGFVLIVISRYNEKQICMGYDLIRGSCRKAMGPRAVISRLSIT